MSPHGYFSRAVFWNCATLSFSFILSVSAFSPSLPFPAFISFSALLFLLLTAQYRLKSHLPINRYHRQDNDMFLFVRVAVGRACATRPSEMLGCGSEKKGRRRTTALKLTERERKKGTVRQTSGASQSEAFFEGSKPADPGGVASPHWRATTTSST